MWIQCVKGEVLHNSMVVELAVVAGMAVGVKHFSFSSLTFTIQIQLKKG